MLIPIPLVIIIYAAGLIHFGSAQFISVRSLGNRVPGRCPAGCFDCGLGIRCVSIKHFHDGKPDCPDGSDEWCLPGYVRCGPYCVEIKYLGACLFHPKCDGKQGQPGFCGLTKEKLCREPHAFPCKGYGECVMWPWLRDGKADCLDESDEKDNEYITILERGWQAYLDNARKLSEGGLLPPPALWNHTGQGPLPYEGPNVPIDNGYGPPYPTARPTYGLPPQLPPTTPRYPFLPWTKPTQAIIEPYPRGPIYPAENTYPTVPTISNNQTIYGAGPRINDTLGTPINATKEMKPGEVRITVHPHSKTTADKSKEESTYGQKPGEHAEAERPHFPSPEDYEDLEHMGQGKQTIQPSLHRLTHIPFYPIPFLPPLPFPTGLPQKPVSTSAPGTNVVGGAEGPFYPEPGIYEVGGKTSTEQEHFQPEPPYGSVPGMERLPNQWTASPYFPENIQPVRPGTMSPQGTVKFITGSYGTGVPRNTTEVTQTQTEKYGQGYETTLKTGEGGGQPNIVHPTLIPFDFTPTLPTEPTTTRTPFGGVPIPIIPIPLPVFTPATRVPVKITEVPWFVESTAKTSSTVGSTPKSTMSTSGDFYEEETTWTSPKGTTSTISASEQTYTTTTSRGGTESGEQAGVTRTQTGQTSEEHTTIEQTAIEKCENDLKRAAAQNFTAPYCDCSAGQFKLKNDGECVDANVSFFAVNLTKPCGAADAEDFSDDELASITIMKLTSALHLPLCIQSVDRSGRAVVGASCNGCTLDTLSKSLANFDDQPVTEISQLHLNLNKVPMKLDSLGMEVCEDSSLNNCHRYAECEPSGLRYRCRCKKGTNDTSDGLGLVCEGIPEDEDCIFILGVCLIFWVILALGLLFLCPLMFYCCWAIWKRCAKSKRKVSPNVAFNTKPTVIDIDRWDHSNTARLLRQHLGPRAQGVLASGEALQKLQLKSILKTSDSTAQILEVASIEEDAKPKPSPELPSRPTTFDAPPTARSLPGKESSIAEALEEQLPHVLPKMTNKRAELAHSPTPPTARGTPVQSRSGSAHTAMSATPRSAGAHPQTAPASPVFSIKVPVGSKTAPSTPQGSMKEDRPPVFNTGGSPTSSLAVSESRQTIATQPTSPAPSVMSKPGAPTIWETYRVLGDMYAKPTTAREDSSDSLEKLINARYPTPVPKPQAVMPSQETRENGSSLQKDATPPENIPGTEGYSENPPPFDNGVELPVEALVTAEDLQAPELGITEPKGEPQTDNSSQQKLAEMLGVTLDNVPSSSGSLENEKRDIATGSLQADDTEKADYEKRLNAPVKVDHVDEAALVELALRGLEIEVPGQIDLLEAYKNKPMTSGAVENTVTSSPGSAEYNSPTTSDPSPPGRVKKGPTFRRKCVIAKPVRAAQGSRLPVRSDLFVPKGGKRKKEKTSPPLHSMLPRPSVSAGKPRARTLPRGDALSTEEESDLDVAIHRFDQSLRKREQSSLRPRRQDLDIPSNRRHKKRRKPERQLSSISEKSAEIGEEVLMSPDYIMSAPTTTRDLAEFQPILPGRAEVEKWKSPDAKRTKKTNRLEEPQKSFEDTSDVDIPKEAELKKTIPDSEDIDTGRVRRPRPSTQTSERTARSPPRQSSLHNMKIQDSGLMATDKERNTDKAKLSPSPSRKPSRFRSKTPLKMPPGSPSISSYREEEDGQFFPFTDQTGSHYGIGPSTSRDTSNEPISKGKVERPRTRTLSGRSVAQSLSGMSLESGITNKSGRDGNERVRASERNRGDEKASRSQSRTSIDRSSTIGRKIASRRHLQDIHRSPSTSRIPQTARDSKSKSCGDLCDWCKHESDSSAFYMPAIKSRKQAGFYSERGTPSFRSSSSLKSIRKTQSQFDVSPYYDPKTDSKKPHKEGLWWGKEHA